VFDMVKKTKTKTKTKKPPSLNPPRFNGGGFFASLYKIKPSTSQ